MKTSKDAATINQLFSMQDPKLFFREQEDKHYFKSIFHSVLFQATIGLINCYLQAETARWALDL